MMLQNQAWLKESYLTVYKNLIDIASDSTFQLTCKKLPLVEFWCSIKEYP